MNAQRLSLVALGLSLLALVVALVVLLGEEPSHGGRATTVAPARGQRAPTIASRGSSLSAREHVQAGGRVEGKVVDLDGGPVSEGTVSFECAATGRPLRGVSRLDELGAFEGLGCPGEVCVQLHHPQLIPAEPWVIEAGKPQELYARALPRLAVRVTHDGAPVAAARAYVMQAEDDPTAMPAFAQATAISDADGQFSLSKVELPPCDPCAQKRGLCELGEPRRDVIYRGAFVMTVSAKGFVTSVVELDGIPDEELSVELTRPTLLTRGQVLGADGQPFPRADVIFRSNARPKESHRARLEQGRFEVAELASGTYSMRVIQDGVELISREEVEAGSELELKSDIDAGGVRLRLRVVDAAGTPLASIRVDGGPFGRGQATDARGELVAEDVVAGHYRGRLWVQGGTPKQVSFDLDTASVRDAKASIAGEMELSFVYEPPQSARD